MKRYDCVLYTLAAFSRRSLQELANETNVMNGPSLGPSHVTDMVQQVRIGTGRYQVFSNLNDAENYMLRESTNEFAIGYSPRNGEIGHMTCAFNSRGRIVYVDCQQNLNPAPRPNYNNMYYYVWPIHRHR